MRNFKTEKIFKDKFKIIFVGEESDIINFLNVVVYDKNIHFNYLSNQWEASIDYIDFINNEEIGSTMKLQPYKYQKESIRFVLDNKNALLVLPCGAGKTSSGIGMFLEAHKRDLISGKGMIVVKASLKVQWVKEVSKFSDLKAVAIESPSAISSSIKAKINKNKKIIASLDKVKDIEQLKTLRETNKELNSKIEDRFKEQFEGYDLFVVNYEALLNDTVKKELHRIKPDFIFADEVHMIGSKDSKRSKALQEFTSVIKVGATATPITKNPENIFSIFKFINPELFPSWSKFAADYIKWAGRGRIAGVRNQTKLVKEIAPYIMIKSKEEISDQLPKLQVIQRYCSLTNEQYEMNETIMEQLKELKEIDKNIREGCKTDFEAKNNPELLRLGAQILALQTFSQELANEPRLLAMSDSEFSKKFVVNIKNNPKLDLFMDIFEEIIESGEKVAVFSKFERMQHILTEAINKYDKSIGIAYINGTISSSQRYEEAYTKFRDTPEYKVLLLSNSGAEGINLSQCKYLIEYDLADSYAIQTQRHGRLERADSVHDNVTVYQLIASDSWDEIALKIIEKKENYDIELIKSTIDS